MKSFLKLLGINLGVGLAFVLLVTLLLNGELAVWQAYTNYLIGSLLIPGIVASAVQQRLLLKK